MLTESETMVLDAPVSSLANAIGTIETTDYAAYSGAVSVDFERTLSTSVVPPKRQPLASGRLDLLNALALIAVALGIAGFVIGVVSRGNPAGILLPVGLAMWLLVGFLARQRDRRPHV